MLFCYLLLHILVLLCRDPSFAYMLDQNDEVSYQYPLNYAAYFYVFTYLCVVCVCVCVCVRACVRACVITDTMHTHMHMQTDRQTHKQQKVGDRGPWPLLNFNGI